jgi:hypothetical protein
VIEVSQLLKKPNPAIYAGLILATGFALFLANPNYLGLPLYVTNSKTWKLQLNLNAVNIAGADNAKSDIQYKEKINGFRNRFAEEGYSEAGEEVWNG